jgi:carbamoyl-phosphate synthase large subunit
VPTLAHDTRAFEQRMLEIFAREDPDLLVPCRDQDVQWLAELGERRADLRARLLCGASRLAEIANDKWLSYEFCRSHALPFAPSLASGDTTQVSTFVRAHGFPLVAKPRNGVDSKGVLILTTSAQVSAVMARPGYVLQRCIGGHRPVQAYLARLRAEGIPLFHSLQGVKHSLQTLIGPDGTIEHAFCTRIRITGQGSRSVDRDHDPEPHRIAMLCARIFSEAGWRGPLNIQCEATSSGELMIHEFNVRFTGSSHDRWLLGLDEVGAVIRRFTGHAIDAGFSWRDTPLGVLERLVPRAADQASVRTLTERGEWRQEGN